MAGPGDEMTGGAAGDGRMRVSHADREQVIEVLKDAFAQGRLTRDELDTRAGQAFASRTCADLAALTADLPAGLSVTKPRKPARPRGGQPVPRPARWIAVFSAAYAADWAYIVFLSPHGGDNPSFPGLIVGGGIAYLVALALNVMTMAGLRREKRCGGQPPRRPAGAGGQLPRDLPSAGPDWQLPPVEDDHRHTTEAARSRRARPALPGWRPLRRWRPAGCLPQRPTIAVQSARH